MNDLNLYPKLPDYCDPEKCENAYFCTFVGNKCPIHDNWDYTIDVEKSKEVE